MRRLLVLLPFLIAACGSFGPTQAHAISLAYKTGDTYTYGFHSVMSYTVGLQGMSIPVSLDFSAREKITVKLVESSGIADLTVDLMEMSIKTVTNGTTSTTSSATTTTIQMQVAPDGQIVSVNGSALGGGSLPGLSQTQGGLISAILPDKPVKPGDTWTKDFDRPSPTGSGSVHATSSSRYVRDERVGGVNAAMVESTIKTKIDITLDMTSAVPKSESPLLPAAGAVGDMKSMALTGSVTSNVTSWVDVSARRVVRTHSSDTVDATMTITMAPGATMPMLSGPIAIKGTQTLDMTPA